MNSGQVTVSFERQPEYIVCYSPGTEGAQAVFKQGNDVIKLYDRKMTEGDECQVDWGAKGLESGKRA